MHLPRKRLYLGVSEAFLIYLYIRLMNTLLSILAASVARIEMTYYS